MAKQNVKEEEVIVDVASFTTRATNWYHHNQKKVLIVLGAFVVGIAGWYAYKANAESKNKKVAAAMYPAETLFENGKFLEALKGDSVTVGFESLASQYGSDIAEYYAGICNLNLGKYDDAISYLEKSDVGGGVLPIARYGALGDLYSQKQNFSKALDMYEKAANAGDSEDLKAVYLKRFAELSEVQGKAAAAVEAYKKLKEKYGNTPSARDIDKYIARASAAAGK